MLCNTLINHMLCNTLINHMLCEGLHKLYGQLPRGSEAASQARAQHPSNLTRLMAALRSVH